MALLTTVSTRLSVRGRLRLAHVLRMPERNAEAEIQKIESTREFQLLRQARVISLRPYAGMRFSDRRFAGLELRASDQGLPQVLDGRGDLVRLMERIGQERFEAHFLRGDDFSDDERGRGCGISPEQVRQLRELVDRLYVQTEFETAGPQAAPDRTMSAVAGIEMQDGRPLLSFFHREIWKCRYAVDPAKRAEFLAMLAPAEARDVEGLLFRLDLVERRKSTLYHALETLIATQADYFITRDPARRVSFTQRRLAAKLGVAPSSFNMLISNKAIQLPWGLEAPIKVLLPSAKSLLLGRIYELAREYPRMSDAGLGSELSRRFGATLSRRSVAQYRSDLGIGGNHQRTAAA